MIKIWNKALGRPVTPHEGQILYKMAGDIVNFAAAHGLSAEQGGELTIAMFKYVLTKEGWKGACVYIKQSAIKYPKGETFYAHQVISVMNRFWPQALYAYVQAILPPADAKLPTGWDPGWKGWKVMLHHIDQLCWKEFVDAEGEWTSDA